LRQGSGNHARCFRSWHQSPGRPGRLRSGWLRFQARTSPGPPVGLVRVRPVKAPSIAALLSLVFPGLGHAYVGEAKRSVAFAVGGVINFLLIFGYIGFLTAPLWWIVGAVDAYQGARNLNAGFPHRPSVLTLRTWALIHIISVLGWTVFLRLGFFPRAAPWLVWGAVAVTIAGFLVGIWTILRRGPVWLIVLAALPAPIASAVVEIVG